MPPGPAQSRSRIRSAAGAVSSPGIDENTRKVRKVSRACDQCKARKTRCSGTLPCERCVLRRLACVYDAEYARGRPPTPPPSLPTTAPVSRPTVSPGSEPSTTAGNSPEEVAAAAEVERQDFDPTSGLAFFQRAHQRLVAQQTRSSINATNPLSAGGDHAQLLTSAGDKPLLLNDAATDSLSAGGPAVSLPPPPPDFLRLVEFYFENCVVTYRMFSQQKHVVSWAQVAQRNTQQGFAITHGLGHAKAAIVLAIVAIAVRKSDRAQLHAAGTVQDERPSLQKADRYYAMAASLIETEVGLPSLESVQARLVQVLYLLQTSRMNKAWYLLGATWQVAAALELHRQHSRKRGASSGASTPPDYVTLQDQRRTFWVAYTIDVYLSVVMGRPRHIHDDDVDQELPAAVSDEDMRPEGPISRVDREEEGEEGDETDSHMDSVIAHAQLARIIATISSEVYSIKNIAREDRLAAASRLGQELSAWRSRLPPHLSSVQPRSLIPSLRRQAIAMRLAYCHAVMHANRPFLLGGNHATPVLEEGSVTECIASAKTALKTVQSMAADSTLLHAFWWTPYVTFCALAVVYIWEIQQSANGRESSDEDRKVLELAEKCHARLAQSMSADSPSWRYTLILEELRQSARVPHAASGNMSAAAATNPVPSSERLLAANPESQIPVDDDQPQPPLTATAYAYSETAAGGGSEACSMPLPFFQEWQTTDWRDLDASAFGLFGDLTTSLAPFIPDDMT